MIDLTEFNVLRILPLESIVVSLISWVGLESDAQATAVLGGLSLCFATMEKKENRAD